VKQKQALLFVNKKKQKNFINAGAGDFTDAGPTYNKIFLVLFLKKELLP
jgi:hypothetical protein